jgi:hypothetical protein
VFSNIVGEEFGSAKVPKVTIRMKGGKMTQKKASKSVDSKRSNQSKGTTSASTKKATFAELAAKLPVKIQDQEIKRSRDGPQ